jgi:uncharacterized membrane protein (DUF4010 family)
LDIIPLILWKLTNILEKSTAFILRIEKHTRQESSMNQPASRADVLTASFMLVSCLACSSILKDMACPTMTLKMEAICSSGNLAYFHWTTQYLSREENTLYYVFSF